MKKIKGGGGNISYGKNLGSIHSACLQSSERAVTTTSNINSVPVDLYIIQKKTVYSQVGLLHLELKADWDDKYDSDALPISNIAGIEQVYQILWQPPPGEAA